MEEKEKERLETLRKKMDEERNLKNQRRENAKQEIENYM